MIPAIKNRRAVRDFLNEAVPEEKISELLRAASFAPSANARYPWELVIIKEQATKELLSKATPWATFAVAADIIIAVLGNESESAEWVEDCSIVTEHLWLEAAEQGLGACWIQIRDQSNAESDVRVILNIPEKMRVLCLLAIGVPSSPVEPHQDEAIDRSRIKFEKYK